MVVLLWFTGEGSRVRACPGEVVERRVPMVPGRFLHQPRTPVLTSKEDNYVNTTRRTTKVLSLVAVASVAIAACGSDDEPTTTDADTTEDTAAEGDTTDETTAPEGDGDAAPEGDGDAAPAAGGDFIDLGTFVGDPPEHLDPALNSTLDAYQVINAVYDGLTEVDSSNPADVKIVPLLAETVEPNEDASVWTFTIKEGAQFSDGEEINASTFQNSWERAADLAGDYSYLLTFIDGGTERLAGEADTISGVVADDATRTLTVTLDAPYSNFDAVAGFQLMFPVPAAAIEAGADWENGIMVGNGPYHHGRTTYRRGDPAQPQRELAGRLQRRDLAGPDQHDHVPYPVRPRHRLQRIRSRRGRQRQHPARTHPGGRGQLGHHPRLNVLGFVPLRDQRS